MQLADDIGVPYREITYLAAGINHMAFYLRFERAARDLYPLIQGVVDDGRVPDNRVRYEMLMRLGYFVTESSEHFAEYTPYFIRRDRPDLIARFTYRSTSTSAARRTTCGSLAEVKRRLATGEPLEVLREGEPRPRYIHAMATGAERIEYGNVRNDGLIENLPGRLLRRGPLPDRRGRRAPDGRRRPAPARWPRPPSTARWSTSPT